MRDQKGRLALHDEVDLDHIPRTVVVHDAGIDGLNLVGKRHRLVGDQVLEVERGGFAGEVLEVGRAGAAPGEDEDDYSARGGARSVCVYQVIVIAKGEQLTRDDEGARGILEANGRQS